MICQCIHPTPPKKPQLNWQYIQLKYTTYILPIGWLYYLPPIKGTRKLHWNFYPNWLVYFAEIWHHILRPRFRKIPHLYDWYTSSWLVWVWVSERFWWVGIQNPLQKLDGGNSNIFYFHPYLGKVPILTNISSDGLVQPPTRKFPSDERSWGEPVFCTS